MNKINIDSINSNNDWDVKVNVVHKNWYGKYITKIVLFLLVWCLFWICLYWYSLSQSKEDKALLDYKEAIHNNDSANKNSLDIIKREQNLINDRTKLNDKYKKEIEKIVNKYSITSLFISKTYADEEKHTLDIKIEKFCKQYWEEKWLQDYISKCIKHWKAMMRFETWWVCKNKDYNNNCFNFRSISKKNREWFIINWVDKSWFTIFWDKTNSVKYFAFRFYKYDYRKTTAQIVWWGTYINLQWKKVTFWWFTMSTWDHKNYISFINNFKE